MIRSRYRRIVWFFARLILSLAYWELILPRIGLRGKSTRTRPKRLSQAAIRFRALAIQMGGVLIKVGQFLSARVDVLPKEFTEELEGLQDEVPAVAFEEIQQSIEAEFHTALEVLFLEFEPVPLAAASLGQVHCALIKSAPGEYPNSLSPAESNSDLRVVVKVLRPNIEQIIETDLAALRTVGKWLHRYRPIRKRVNVPGLLAEFSRILWDEVDYFTEGRNAETFAANFRNYPGVRVPGIIWTHTSRRVLTLDNVYSIKITDYPEIQAAGIKPSEVASRLLDTYLKQIFEDGFFHADPHPGNLFVHPVGPGETIDANSQEWELTFVDFGMTGQVPNNLRMGLRELLIGVGTRDADRVVKSYQMMDMLLPNADLEVLKRIDERVFDQFWGKNMSELSSVSYQEMKDMADEFREVIYEMPFQVPQNVIFLARCVGILSGMCTGLDPQFNLWAHLAPYARKIMAEEAKKTPEWWLSEAEKLTRSLISLPRRLDMTLTRIERGELNVRSREISDQVRRLSAAVRSLTSAVIFSVFFIGGILLFIEGQSSIGSLSVILGAVFLIHAVTNRGS